MDGKPSSLSHGDTVTYRIRSEPPLRGIVTTVHDNGAFIKAINEHGVRLLRKEDWCSDDSTFVEEVNGESLF